ncbi:MAG: glucokinase [Burkholderiales bacterium]|nr:glucokinase [Burkholderiales bacterium]
MNLQSVQYYPSLVGDVGGTNVRFALIKSAEGKPEDIMVLSCADYPSLQAALQKYLQFFPNVIVRNACIGIANPVLGDIVRMTNFNWEFSIEELRIATKLDQLLVVNDFRALATAVPSLQPGEYRQIGSGCTQVNAPIALIGPGTGLGVASLFPCGEEYVCIEGEGGHSTLPSVGFEEAEVVLYIQREYAHVSAERVLSGPGIETLYRALAATRGLAATPLDAASISEAALNGSDRLAKDTLDMFCGMLGCVAGNLAITLGARGGVFIGGGIVPKLGNYFNESSFRKRFESKGRFSSYMSNIPSYVIDAPYSALTGASILLKRALC